MDMPVYYYSKWLNDTEALWSTYERELYAMVQAFSKWRCYLVNRNTIVYSNHQHQQYFMSQPKLSAKQQRWLYFLADFSIDVQYHPGKHNILPDVLSQQPAPPIDVHPYGDASLLSIVLEPIWLTKAYQGQQSDVTLRPFVEKAKSSDNELIVCQVYGLPLLYHNPKTEVYQLVIPDDQGLCQLLLGESHCTPLAGHMGACKNILALQ